MCVDTIITSTAVFDTASGDARPAALALADDRIVFVGSLEETQAFARRSGGAKDALVLRDFGDALIVPGFHDSHLHFFHSALYTSPLAATFTGTSEADCVLRMQEFAKRRPGGWLLAQGWQEYLWDNMTLPSKASLDAAFPDRPVALYSGDAHTLWLNSAAFETLGVTRESEPPEGGIYDRDVNGELTGVVREAAAMELMPHIVGTFSDEEIIAAYRDFFVRLAENGITSICDMSLRAHPGSDFIRDDIHAKLLARGELTARVHMFPTLLDDFDRFETMRTQYNSPLLQTSGLKQFFDGVSSQHTAWVQEPYTNAHFEGDCGHPTVDPSLMRKRIHAAAQKGYAVRIHTIGDAAIHEALDILEDTQVQFGTLPYNQHHCLEHVENFQPADIARLARLGVIAAVQPAHMTLDPGGPERDLGDVRVSSMWPLRTLLSKGTTLAFGTDSPVTAIRSMDVLFAAVTRQDPKTHEPHGGWLPEERISRADALRAYTQGSAAAASRNDELGALEVGMLADIAVLDQNILTCNANDMQKAAVLATFVGGRCVFER